MPPFRFTDPPRIYPENRDAHGRPLGLVETGDVRDLAEPPDHRWVPADDGQDAAAEADEAPEEDAPAPEPAPAVMPSAFVPPAAQA
jgi:hypothetical protein